MFIIVATNDGNGGIVSILVILLVVSGINGGSSDNNLLLLSPLVICYCRVALSILFATLSLLLIQYENENLNISICVGISYMDLDNNFVYSFGNLELPKLIFSFFSNYVYSYFFVSFCFSKTFCFLLFLSFCFSKTVCFLPTWPFFLFFTLTACTPVLFNWNTYYLFLYSRRAINPCLDFLTFLTM